MLMHYTEMFYKKALHIFFLFQINTERETGVKGREKKKLHTQI